MAGVSPYGVYSVLSSNESGGDSYLPSRARAVACFRYRFDNGHMAHLGYAVPLRSSQPLRKPSATQQLNDGSSGATITKVAPPDPGVRGTTAWSQSSTHGFAQAKEARAEGKEQKGRRASGRNGMKKAAPPPGAPCRVNGSCLTPRGAALLSGNMTTRTHFSSKADHTRTEATGHKRKLAQSDSLVSTNETSKASCLPVMGGSRRDFTEIKPRTRGSMEEALRVASDPLLLNKAKTTLQQGFYATRSWDTLLSHQRGIMEIADAAGITLTTPLSEDAAITVAASLQAAGYRSGSAFMGALRVMQLEAKDTITPCMTRLYKKIDDSLQRGLGPPDKAPELLVSLLVTDDGFKYFEGPVLGGPDCYVVAHSYLLREIELSAVIAIKEHIIIKTNGDVGLCLPISKSDPTGKTVTRFLSCICYRITWWNAQAESVCGPCAVKRQLTRLHTSLEYDWLHPKNEVMRLFPHLSGKTAKKEEVILTWNRACDLKVATKGHTARRSGAKAYIRCGWSLWQVQSLARHTSDAILGYVEEAAAELSAEWNRQSPTTTDQPYAPNAATALVHTDNDQSHKLHRLEAALQELQCKLKLQTQTQLAQSKDIHDQCQASEEFKEFCAQKWTGLEAAFNIKAMDRDASWIAISQSFSPLWGRGDRQHKIVMGSLSLEKCYWVTECGWHFGLAEKMRLLRGPVETEASKLCKKCHRTLIIT